MPTGFDRIDDLTSGLQKSDLIIIAGSPSMGKTALALNIARHAAVEMGLPVAVFSLEMARSNWPSGCWPRRPRWIPSA